MASHLPPPRNQPPAWVRQFAMAMELPFLIVGGALIGGGLGYLLDRWLHTSPVFMLILGLFGFAGGTWNVLRSLTRSDRGKSDGNG
jgi:F0F1-type ATP synthase assembly protein I